MPTGERSKGRGKVRRARYFGSPFRVRSVSLSHVIRQGEETSVIKI